MDEYNRLHTQSKVLYKEFFDLYYQLKLKSGQSHIKWPFREKELEEVKEIMKFQKIKKDSQRNKQYNPLYDIVECDYKGGKLKRLNFDL